MTNINERRQWPRTQVKHPVSFKYCSNDSTDDSWFFGVTRDISVTGMKIVSSAEEPPPVASKLSIICFPKKIGFRPHDQASEPIWIKADVVWQDSASKSLGLQIIS